MLRRIRVGNDYKTVELSKDEMTGALAELMQSNMDELQICFNKAEEFAKKQWPDMEVSDDTLRGVVVKIALSLFNKQGIASFTALANAMDKKIVEIRGG